MKTETLIEYIDFDGDTFDQAITAIERMKTDPRLEGFTNIKFRHERDYNDTMRLVIRGDRPETTAELEYEAKLRTEQEARDRLYFEKLKQRFEP